MKIKRFKHLLLLIFAISNIYANETQIVLQLGHLGPVTSLEYSPDGKYLASGSGDQTIKIWDLNSGLLVRTLTGHQNEITDIRFSSTGDTLLSSSKDNTLKLWDIKSGNLLTNYCCSRLIYTSTDFHPHSRLIISSSYDGEISIWNTFDNQKPIRKFKTKAPITKIRFSADGKFYFTSDTYGDLNIYTIENPEKLFKTLKHNNLNISDFEYSPEANIIAAKCANDSVYVWDLNRYELIRTFFSNSESIALSDNGRFLSFIEGDNELTIKNVISSKNEFILNSIGSDLLSISFSKDNSSIAAGYMNGKVLLWKIGKSKSFIELSGVNEPINAMAYSANSNSLATIIEKNVLAVWSFDKESPYRTYNTNMQIVYDIVSDESGDRIYLVGQGFKGGIANVDLINGEVSFFRDSENKYTSCDLLAKDKLLLATTTDSLFVFNISTQELISSAKVSDGILNKAKFIQKTGQIVLIDESSKIWLYDLSNNRIKSLEFKKDILITSFDISKVGNSIFAGTNEGSILIIDINNFSIIKNIKIRGSNSYITAVKQSYDGNLLSIGRSDNSITIFEANNYSEVYNFTHTHINIVQFLEFFKESKFLFSGSTDGLVKLWNLENNKLDAVLYGMQNFDWSIVSNRARYDGSIPAINKLHWVINNKTSLLTSNYLDMYKPGLINLLFDKKLEEINYLGETPKAVAGFMSPPSVFINEPIDYDTTSHNNFLVEYELRRGTNGLSYMSIFHNNKIVYSKKISYSDNSEIIDRKLFQLLPGENVITIKVIDLENFESEKSVRIYNIRSESNNLPVIHILSIGLSEYSNEKFNLNYAQKDAESIASQLYNKNRSLVKSFNKYIFTNSQATKAVIIKSLNEIEKKATENDIFILFYAGHGLIINTSEKKELFHLSLYNSFNDNDNSMINPSELLSTEELGSFIERIKARKQLLLIDACNSKKAIEIFDIKKDLSSLALKTGISVLSATATQSAYETHILKHGAFTFALLQGIDGDAKRRDNKVTVSSLKAFIDYKLPILSNQYLPEEQIPFGWIAGVDFIIGEVE